jgi:hypothetical protein
MKLFKYSCAALGLSYLISALLPASIIVTQPTAVTSEWVGRLIYIGDFLLLSAMIYGVQKRTPIYWKLIPGLLGVFLLSVVIGTLWSLIALSMPWVPFTFIITFIFIGFLAFIAWWRNQKSYFA